LKTAGLRRASRSAGNFAFRAATVGVLQGVGVAWLHAKECRRQTCMNCACRGGSQLRCRRQQEALHS
jgi:hypothetical protein